MPSRNAYGLVITSQPATTPDSRAGSQARRGCPREPHTARASRTDVAAMTVPVRYVVPTNDSTIVLSEAKAATITASWRVLVIRTIA